MCITEVLGIERIRCGMSGRIFLHVPNVLKFPNIFILVVSPYCSKMNQFCDFSKNIFLANFKNLVKIFMDSSEKLRNERFRTRYKSCKNLSVQLKKFAKLQHFYQSG